MRRGLSYLLVMLAFVGGIPTLAAPRASPAGCNAALVVLRSYADGPGMIALSDLTGGPRTGDRFPLAWSDAPPTALRSRFLAEPQTAFAAGCVQDSAVLRGLGVVQEGDPAASFVVSINVATVSADGRAALVETFAANTRGFGGHCMLYHLRRGPAGWSIVDKRATCVV